MNAPKKNSWTRWDIESAMTLTVFIEIAMVITLLAILWQFQGIAKTVEDLPTRCGGASHE